MSKKFLIDLEQKALAKRREGACRDALALWLELVRLDPGWEHGMAHHEVSSCFEELGDYQMAKQHLEITLSIEPENEMYIGAKASFEYLHGDPAKALELYLTLAHAYRNREQMLNQIKPAINELGTRLGLHPTVTATLLTKALESDS